jgi:hypothetical protein
VRMSIKGQLNQVVEEKNKQKADKKNLFFEIYFLQKPVGRNIRHLKCMDHTYPSLLLMVSLSFMTAIDEYYLHQYSVKQ